MCLNLYDINIAWYIFETFVSTLLILHSQSCEQFQKTLINVSIRSSVILSSPISINQEKNLVLEAFAHWKVCFPIGSFWCSDEHILRKNSQWWDVQSSVGFISFAFNAIQVSWTWTYFLQTRNFAATFSLSGKYKFENSFRAHLWIVQMNCCSEQVQRKTLKSRTDKVGLYYYERMGSVKRDVMKLELLKWIIGLLPFFFHFGFIPYFGCLANMEFEWKIFLLSRSFSHASNGFRWFCSLL